MASTDDLATLHGRDGGSRGSQSFPKRFFKQVGVEPVEGGYALLLDGRPARSPGRNALVLPTAGFADAVAAEWQALDAIIDPRRLPLTRLANTVVDGVSRMCEEVFAEIVRFAGSDLLLYRAESPDTLVILQQTAWDPIVTWVRETHRAPLLLATGVIHVQQPAKAMENVSRLLLHLAGNRPAMPFRLAALHVITTLTGSALLAAAVAAKRLSAEDAWAAAHVDEDFQIAAWGADEEAAERRAARWADMKAADATLAFTR